MYVHRLVHSTVDGDNLIAEMARVSAPENEKNVATAPKLIARMLRYGEVSPFEMCDMCLELNTPLTRDVSRQLIRHYSFKFQEFSQRYASVGKLGPMVHREARMQDTKNRQSSLPCEDEHVSNWWRGAQAQVETLVAHLYNKALGRGIAKEVARVLLPEGMTPTRVYMKGTVRSWLFFCELRMQENTQQETRLLATEAWEHLKAQYPSTVAAFELLQAEKRLTKLKAETFDKLMQAIYYRTNDGDMINDVDAVMAAYVEKVRNEYT